MQATMMDVPLSLNHLLERAGQLFGGNEIVSRLPDKSLLRHTLRAVASPHARAWRRHCSGSGCSKGDRVATLAGTTTRTSSATSASRPPAA